MKASELYPKLEEYLLGLKGVEITEKDGGKIFSLVRKPFAAIFDETVEIKAKADYNETIRMLHSDIRLAEKMGDGWNSIICSGEVPYEVVTDMADRGYRMTYASLPKKVQREVDEYYYG